MWFKHKGCGLVTIYYEINGSVSSNWHEMFFREIRNQEFRFGVLSWKQRRSPSSILIVKFDTNSFFSTWNLNKFVWKHSRQGMIKTYPTNLLSFLGISRAKKSILCISKMHSYLIVKFKALQSAKLRWVFFGISLFFHGKSLKRFVSQLNAGSRNREETWNGRVFFNVVAQPH